MRRADLGDSRAEIERLRSIPVALRYVGDALVHLADVIGSQPAPVVHVHVDDGTRVEGGC